MHRFDKGYYSNTKTKSQTRSYGRFLLQKHLTIHMGGGSGGWGSDVSDALNVQDDNEVLISASTTITMPCDYYHCGRITPDFICLQF